MNTEHIDISPCPKCKGKHRYRLDVERALVMKMSTQADFNERPRQVKFTRFFTCPTKNEEFQASFTLTDTSSDRIERVRVVGTGNDNNKD
jgi:Zn-finger nucleic acid-binding protein